MDAVQVVSKQIRRSVIYGCVGQAAWRSGERCGALSGFPLQLRQNGRCEAFGGGGVNKTALNLVAGKAAPAATEHRAAITTYRCTCAIIHIQLWIDAHHLTYSIRATDGESVSTRPLYRPLLLTHSVGTAL